MSEQAPPPPPPQPPPGYPAYDPYGRSYYPPPATQARPMDRLTWKQKIILGAVILVLLFSLGVWNSCNTKSSNPVATRGQQPTLLAPNPQTIESQREQAQRELDAAQAAAEAAKKRLEAGPTVASPTTASAGAQQNPDAEFWHQMRQAKWKREQEAPYASGVGFVTRRPRSEQRPDEATREIPNAVAAIEQPTTVAKAAMADQQPPSEEPLNKYDSLDHSEGPLHRLDEGAILPATLLNQLDGEFAGPVICQVSENVYDASGLDLLIPAGSKVLGEAHAVSNNNQQRLAVAFHRITMPDGYSLSLDKVPGLDQAGATALSGKTNHHYLQTFGMSMAVGAIAGLAQIGNTGAVYSPWYGFREGVSQQTAISSEQILNRYLNRYPTIKIKPGSRVKIILLSDLSDVPEYARHTMPANR